MKQKKTRRKKNKSGETNGESWRQKCSYRSSIGEELLFDGANRDGQIEIKLIDR